MNPDVSNILNALDLKDFLISEEKKKSRKFEVRHFVRGRGAIKHFNEDFFFFFFQKKTRALKLALRNENTALM